MKHLFLSLLLSITLFATAQQQGFNYQAAIQKQDGATLHNQEVTLRISLIGQSSNTVYYSETQNSTTNNFGIVSLVIGQGEALSGNFTDIPWESETILISIELKVDNNFVSMGTSPIMAVPYALHATNAVTGTGTAGKIAVWSGDSQLTDVKSFNVNPNVEVISDSTAGDNDPIFEVKNKLGQVVFGVYQAGVRINVDDTNNAKAGKGGFAIGGLSSYKNNDNKFFRVTPDSVRVLLRENQGKAGKGGFAIGGLSSGKEVTQDLFFIDRDSARIYISTDSTKAGKGGFAIGGLSSGKGLPVKNIFVATVDSTKIYVSEETGDGSSGRFTVGGRSTAKGEGKNYFDINTSTVPDTITNQNRVLWYPQKNAFMAGRLYVVSVDSVGENSFQVAMRVRLRATILRHWAIKLWLQAQTLPLLVMKPSQPIPIHLLLEKRLSQVVLKATLLGVGLKPQDREVLPSVVQHPQVVMGNMLGEKQVHPKQLATFHLL